MISRLYALLLLMITGVFFVACHGKDKNIKGNNETAILHTAPFQGITDSIQHDPNNAELLLRRAVMLSQSNQHELATEDYRKSWELTNNEGIALQYISNLLLVNELKQAHDLLEEGIQRFPHNIEFRRRLGELYAQMGRPVKALAQYDTLLASDPSNFECWYDKGTLLAQARDTAGAIKALEESFRIMPISYSGLALANIYAEKKDPRALQICDRLIAADSSGQQTDPYYMKGVYYSETGQSAKAIQQFEECIRRDWKMTDAYIEKGIVLYEMRQYNKALEVFTMASTVSNTNPDAYFWMGRCYEATGKKEDAIVNYQRALSLDDSFSEAREHLRKISNS
jgi:tetratricopeptide (TPR) repeat protein